MVQALLSTCNGVQHGFQQGPSSFLSTLISAGTPSAVQACPVDMGKEGARLAAGGDASADKAAGSSSSSVSSLTNSVSVELDRLVMGSDTAMPNDLQHHVSASETLIPSAAGVTPLRPGSAEMLARAMGSLHVADAPRISGSRDVGTAGGQVTADAAAGSGTLSPQSDTDPGDSTPGICTGRRSARKGARRVLAADSESEASPSAKPSQRLSSASPPHSTPLLSTHAATGRQESPPEWMTSARRPARLAAGSPTCSLYATPAPGAPSNPAHHQGQQLELASPANSGVHTPSTGSGGWLARGCPELWTQQRATGACGQAMPMLRTTQPLVRGAGI